MPEKSMLKILAIATAKGVAIGETFPFENQSYRMCITEEGTRFMHPVHWVKRELVSV